MKLQHRVILSLGTNQGNRLENILDCIDLIHQELATVIQVSKVYETPAWGFEGAVFYNCALLVHTSLLPEEVLERILDIEKKLGRIRYEKKEYRDRMIDIDLIAFDELIIDSKNLQVPHPLMQNRRFVLLPMQDLDISWQHPILKKNTTTLIENCPDTSNCIAVHHLESPLGTIFSDELYHIAIEGNIGAGKTTLASRIAQDFGAKTLSESFAANPFLPKFYKDQDRYALPLELSFLLDRHQQLSSDFERIQLQKSFLVADYHSVKSLIFAQITLSAEEFLLYKKVFNLIYKEVPKPDLYVYLHQNSEQLLQNIKKRGREYEQEIDAIYLNKINQGYLDFIASQTELDVLVIDISGIDFVKNQEDYLYILEQIKKRGGFKK